MATKIIVVVTYRNKKFCCNKFPELLYCKKITIAVTYSNNIFCCNK